MKKNIIIGCFSICTILCASYTAYTKKTSGSHPGSTGAPLDLTCAQAGCHTDAQIVPNAVNNNTLIFSSNDSSYVPGGTYNVTVQVKGSDALPTSKFGFELVALKNSDSLNVGQLVITDLSPLRTQLLNYSVGSNSRTSITHKTAGTAALATNFNQWTFNWDAPPVNEGNITFWYATNCTNNNGQNTGDKIYLHSFTIHPANTTSIKEQADDYELKAHFDSESSNLIIDYDLKGKRSVQISVFDITGKNIYSGAKLALSGKQTHKVSLGPNYSKSTYLIQLKINDQKITKKIAIN